MTTKTYKLQIEQGKLIIPSEIENYLINCPDDIEVSLTIKEQSNLSNDWDKWFEETDNIEPINHNQKDKYKQLLINKYKEQGLEL